MALRTANTCIDAHDPIALATWWEQVLDDYSRHEDGAWNDDEAELRGPGGRWLEFLKVPDDKVVKNRMHFCLRPAASDRDAEIERLLAMGATMYDDLRGGENTDWAVLADPEGNEFCVLSTSAEDAGISRG